MAKLTASAPLLMVSDILASSRFYTERLGFTELFHNEDPPVFAMLRRDNMFLMLALGDPAEIKPHWQVRPQTPNAYFWTDDARGLHAEFVQNGAPIDYGPCDQPYGVREFGIQDPDGYDISFGEVLA